MMLLNYVAFLTHFLFLRYRLAYFNPKDAKKKNSDIHQTAGGAVESGVAELSQFVPGEKAMSLLYLNVFIS